MTSCPHHKMELSEVIFMIEARPRKWKKHLRQGCCNTRLYSLLICFIINCRPQAGELSKQIMRSLMRLYKPAFDISFHYSFLQFLGHLSDEDCWSGAVQRSACLPSSNGLCKSNLFVSTGFCRLPFFTAYLMIKQLAAY